MSKVMVKREMTMEQFSEWLAGFDTDKDGRISRDELREAVHVNNGWFSTWKSNPWMESRMQT
ncbi:hypothetical protein Acr_00g0103030 [Actinidia rufa]|uniref:EF-hand domain-containing protein n=1 Tax=Actinidia rufa TaxID=165716 RepID=A0A7J0E0T8_9ERIC|nr:hypothetical protein Acr_00g0103030 [Actinidia rufa]